ncbi:MAG: hypothetical protein ACYDD1_06825 [Caulobacteraceae bacterium]
MSELSDYKRCVSDPQIARLNERIASLSAALLAAEARALAVEERIAKATAILTPMSRQFYSGWYDSDAPKHHVAIKAETVAKSALAALEGAGG